MPDTVQGTHGDDDGDEDEDGDDGDDDDRGYSKFYLHIIIHFISSGGGHKLFAELIN